MSDKITMSISGIGKVTGVNTGGAATVTRVLDLREDGAFPLPESTEAKPPVITEVVDVTPEMIAGWKNPRFQRPLVKDKRYRTMVDDFRATGESTGVVWLSQMGGEIYRVDGQHRCAAIVDCGRPSVRTVVCMFDSDSFEDMARKFQILNGHVRAFTAGDFLRAMEDTHPLFAKVMRANPCVGYTQVKMNQGSPVVSASVMIRAWNMSARATPSISGPAAPACVAALNEHEVEGLNKFMSLALEAWGRDPEHGALWNGLNLTIAMWLFRRITSNGKYAHDLEFSRSTKIDDDTFKRGLISLTNTDYLEHVRGKRLADEHRAPCYRRMKERFTEVISRATTKKVHLPQPEWSRGKSR